MRTFLIAAVAVCAAILTGCAKDDGPQQPDSWKTADFQEVRLVSYNEFTDDAVDVWIRGQAGDKLIAHSKLRMSGLDARFSQEVEFFEIKRKDGSQRCFPPMVLGNVDKVPYHIGTAHLVDEKGREFAYLSLLPAKR